MIGNLQQQKKTESGSTGNTQGGNRWRMSSAHLIPHIRNTKYGMEEAPYSSKHIVVRCFMLHVMFLPSSSLIAQVHMELPSAA